MASERYQWVDLLNIVACAGVLLLHSTNSEVHSFTQVNTDYLIGLFTHSFFLWPVNVFFMLTGYTIIRRNDDALSMLRKGALRRYWGKRVKRLLIPLLFWQVYYSLMFLHHLHVYDLHITVISFIARFTQFEINAYLWFFIPLLGVYIVAPYLSVLYNSLDRKMIEGLLIISVVLVSVPQTFGPLLSISKYNNIFPLGTQYLLFVTAGYYFGNYSQTPWTRKTLYLLGLISALLMMAGTYSLHITDSQYPDLFINYNAIPTVLTAFAVFVFFKHIKPLGTLSLRLFGREREINMSRLLKEMSGLSLGIYLIQMTLFSFLIKVYTPANGICRFIVMYVICIVLVYILKRIPYLNKIV